MWCVSFFSLNHAVLSWDTLNEAGFEDIHAFILKNV